jgi:carboxyl-terminal processing protease
MKRLAKTSVVVLLLLVLIVTTFGAGVAFGQSGVAAEASSGSPAIASATAADSPGDVAVDAPAKPAAGSLGEPVPDALTRPGADALAQPMAGTRADFVTFWEVWDIVQRHFVDREALETSNLEYGAIQGLITALGDEGHTVFLSPDDLERQQTDISGKFSGIGAYVGVRDGLPVIVAPFEGSPAEQAGIKASDIIIEVNGEDVTSWPLSDIVDNIRGEEGTDVVLTLLRPDQGESFEVTVTRGEITVPAATWAMIPGTDVALVRLSQFSAVATDQITEAINEAEAAGATRLIVDVRNNPGGLLQQAIQVTSQFLKNGNVLQQEDADGNRKVFPVLKRGIATDIPIVVLINRGSASSSEIFAGAIQDHERGQLIGETTFGTGTVLEPFTLSDGSGLLLGTSQWLTANGRLIRKQGIEPDITVELEASADLLYPSTLKDLTVEELLGSEDAQVLKALELLNALPEK